MILVTGMSLHHTEQLSLFDTQESRRFLTEQLITYIGSKRALLGFIGSAVEKIKNQLGKSRLCTADLFSGSGIVARFLKQYSDEMVVNDLEPYCKVINRCYLANKSEVDLTRLKNIYQWICETLEREPLIDGIISRLYAPEDDTSIRPGERVFYTKRNARFLDTARQLIDTLPKDAAPFFLAPLLSEASIHANTSGVFKGFYKNRETGIGHFGGKNGDALTRIKGDIRLPFPVFSNFDTDVTIYREDVHTLAPKLGMFDVVYLDPPYNQHPYGSNYFMLNLLVSYNEPRDISQVSGIPADWNRSVYNNRSKALTSFEKLIKEIKAHYLLISFNSEGFIQKEPMVTMLNGYGDVEVMETRYNTFRGSRNLRERNIHVTEYLFLVKKEGYT